MKLGITILATDRTLLPAQLAREVEVRGFHSLYLPEHTHIPVSRTTPAPGVTAKDSNEDGDESDDLSDEYKRTLDPFVALASAATATNKILLGTGVSLILQHHPITLAKSVATLSHISDGRFVLGVGYGWNSEEMSHHGVQYLKRREMLREWLLAMFALWDGEVGEFHGEFVDFSASWSYPKPKNNRPKVLIGGAGGPKLFHHIAELADGWIPIGGAGMKDKLADLKQAAKKTGRDFSEMEIVPFGVIPTPEKLEYYQTIGVTEAVLRLPSGEQGSDEKSTLAALDDLAEFLPS